MTIFGTCMLRCEYTILTILLRGTCVVHNASCMWEECTSSHQHSRLELKGG